MSILIKGMEMPKSCDDCKMRSLGFGKMFCPITSEDVTNQEYAKNRHENCPLIEVPTPHGRLIDADELSKVFDWKQLENSPDEKGQTLYLLGQTTIEAIREVPTIIEAEVSEG